MDQIKSQLDKLSELSDDEIAELKDTIVSEFDSFDSADLTPQSVDSMNELADMLDTVRSEVNRRSAEAEELSARAAEASTRVRGEDVEGSEDVAEDVAPVEASAAEGETEETPVSEPTTEPAETVSESSADEAAEVEAPAEAEAAASEEEAAPAAEEEPEVETTEAPAEDDAVEAPATSEDEAPAEAEETASDEAPADTEAAVEAPAEAAAEEPTEAEASNTEETPEAPSEQEEALTVTAAVNEPDEVQAPADRQPVAEAPVATVAITAGADIPGYSAGSKISDMEEVAKAFTERLRTLSRANGGDGEQHIVASIATDYDEAHTLDGTPEENWDKIAESGEARQAIIASGGYGTPIETRYDIFGFGTDARPVKDSLPKFQANRGGIRFVRPPVLSSYVNAVGVWTNDMDINAAGNNGNQSGHTDSFKNVLVVAGATTADALIDAVTLQLQIGNLLTRAYPELVARHNELALIQHARQAELNLLAKINAASTAVTTSSIIGFARDFLVNVRRASTAYRSRHRIDPATQLQVIAPMWVLDAMAADLALNMPGDDNLSVAKSEINGWLNNLNVSITWSYDQNSIGTQSTGALVEFPDSFTWYLFSEGSFLFLDGGTLDIGIVRDSGLVNTNDYRMFVETFEGLAFVGIESLAITSTIAVNGAAAALRDTLGGVTAAAIEY